MQLLKTKGVNYRERKNEMELIKFIMWLSAGAVIGWFASRVVTAENGWVHKPMPVKDSISEEN
jgi:hypothetical protein